MTRSKTTSASFVSTFRPSDNEERRRQHGENSLKTRTTALLLCALTSPLPASAHHSFVSQYDFEKIVTVEGTVTEVWYQNPHSRVYFEVVAEDGSKELWESETYPRNILDRRGWKYNDLVEGDYVVVTGRLARDGSPRLQMLTIVRPSDGWEGVGFDADSID
jgi:DNA/RNA endonuclease YhcR with UshA esterase domain